MELKLTVLLLGLGLLSGVPATTISVQSAPVLQQNQQWCYRTQCLEDDRAPPSKDYCIYGDYLDKYPDGRTCKDVIAEETYQCYPESIYKYRDDCCQTCMDAKKDVPGCEFGDRVRDCGKIMPRDCYEQKTRTRCCETCPTYSINITGCEYGDKASWCADIAPSSCYVSNDTCCKRCHELETDDPDCRWGDAASWCPGLQPRDCYTSHKTCCGFCKQYNTGIEGCEYGDRNSNCKKDMCKDPSWWDDCCLTCLEESGKTTTPSSSVSTTRSPPPGCEDKAAWCSTMPVRDCYVSAQTCCATCIKYDNGKESCMYGDKVGWCAGYDNEKDCKRDDIREPCCHTCEKYSRMPNLYKFR